MEETTPDTYVEDDDEEAGAKAEAIPTRAPHIPIRKYPGRHGSTLARKNLDQDESNDEHHEQNEQGYDPSVRPGVLCATPLKC